MLQVETKFSIILAFGERWNEKKTNIFFRYQDLFHLEVSVHAHINQLVSNTGKSAILKFVLWELSYIDTKDVRLLALEGSVENADESNQGDEKEPPPKDEENLSQSFSNVTERNWYCYLRGSGWLHLRITMRCEMFDVVAKVTLSLMWFKARIQIALMFSWTPALPHLQ